MEFRFRANGENPSNGSPPPPQPRRQYSTSLNGNYFERHNSMQEMRIATEMERRRQIEAEVRREMTIEREASLRAARAHNLSMFSRSSTMLMNHMLPSLNHSEGTFSEAELTREMMVEREMALREAQAHSFSMFSGSPTRLMNHGLPIFNQAEGRLRNSSPLSHDFEAKKETIINLPNPERDVSLLKRKAETPPPSPSATIPSLDATKKPKPNESHQKINNPKPTFRCEICQVSATSALSLQMHLEGKKHKSTCKRIAVQITEKNFSTGLCSSNAVNKEDVLEKVDEDKSDDMALKVSENSEEIKNNNDGVEFLFWCEMCKFGASCEEDMDVHKVGKEHLSMRLKAIAARG